MEKYALIALLLVFSLVQAGNCAVGSRLEHDLSPLSAFRQKQSREFSCPPEDGFYGIPGECSSSYYACVGGTAILQQCSGTEVFDPEIKKCVPYADASCNNGQTTTPTTTTTTPTTSRTTTSAPGEFTCPAPDGFFPIPGTCDSEYYICVGGNPTLTNCPGDTIFDPETLKCVAPGDASCFQTFTCPTPEGFYPIPGTCSSDFYVCVSGSPYVSTCPNGNIFDPETLICTPPDEASCSVVFTCPSSEGYFTVTGACNKNYYSCIAFHPYSMTCPGATIFSPTLLSCIMEENDLC
ncbi:chondroitin proteoglycan 2 [Daphnia magna]|uniref:chondroitin proteoglycan 2 n=1 Tax=Daphnia magna TaxID=35525 RepID=UPI001E1BB0FD|nr:chondroitin proteoglycan 2 [Daphnia magna]